MCIEPYTNLHSPVQPYITFAQPCATLHKPTPPYARLHKAVYRAVYGCTGLCAVCAQYYRAVQWKRNVEQACAGLYT